MFCTINPVIVGPIIPGIVPNVFEMPIIILANCGAISSLFGLMNHFVKIVTRKKFNSLYLNPAQAKPPIPTARVRQVTTATGESAKVEDSINVACATNAKQVNNLRTLNTK